ncbi:unnamed protein product, partial [Rotaria magnacalcarata]
MRWCARVSLDTLTLVALIALSAQIPAPSTMEDAIRMHLAPMTTQQMR